MVLEAGDSKTKKKTEQKHKVSQFDFHFFRACSLKFVYSVFDRISQNKKLFQNCRLKQVLDVKGTLMDNLSITGF